MEQTCMEIAPISEAYPAGVDVRYEPEFEELQSEIDKLSLPSATTGVDWERVHSLSADILKTKSKDLLVASYFTVADIRLNKLQGFANGLNIYAGLLETYWDDLFPVKKRMRGRIAAVTWLIEKSEAAFDSFEVDPVVPDRIMSLKVQLQRIDAALQEHCDDAPLLRPLERIIEEIPIKEDILSEKPEPEAPGFSDQQEPLKTEKNTAGSAPFFQSERVVPAPSISSVESVSAAEIEKILREAFQTVRQAAGFYFEKDNTNPRGYRCRRIAGWALVQALPPSTSKQTQIPPPGEFETVKRTLLELRGSEKWQELLRESEQRLNGALLWLDLNRFTAESLAGLGSQYHEAYEAVCQETAFLLTRLEGLEKLTFLDGSPLADAETRQWIETIKPGSDAVIQSPLAQSGPVNERMDEIIGQSRSLAAAKKLPEAINLLRSEMIRSPSCHEKLIWRLNLVQLLISHRQIKLALPHLDEVVGAIDTYKVEEWDPQLATHALRIVWLGFKSEKSTRDRAETILARIARINPVEAMQLEK